MVDTLDLGSSDLRRGSSSLLIGTKMNIAVAVASDFKNWDIFQSVMDSMVELYPPKYIVAARSHSLISLYCKIDIVDCYIHSFQDREKYDVGLVFATSKDRMSSVCETFCYSHRPYFIYSADIDEFSYVHVPE